MRIMIRFAQMFRVIPALACIAALAACGVDGEPEQPTRAEYAPTSEIIVAKPR